MKDKIYMLLPNLLQNLLISVFNLLAYRKRYGNEYNIFLKLFRDHRLFTLEQLNVIQKRQFSDFIRKVSQSSLFYKKLYSDLKNIEDINNIKQLPIVNKEMFRKNINKVYTINKKTGIVSKTGGTTGKSLEVLFTHKDMQERFAMLDNFRSGFGYKLGKKTAWFSGKNLLTARDINRNRFWKTDYLHKVRYYSTFHIKEEYIRYYLENLIKFKSEFLIGFPSTMLEIANYGLNHNIDFPPGIVKAIFPTAETVTQNTRETLELFFKTSVYNQYASSEGAPFIFECFKKKLHLELQSGVFEVLNDNDEYTNSGRLIVTSFTTSGTPLIRYDIGDNIELSSERCDCGNNNPLVKQILGRLDDYIFSPENGKINLGNVSNTLKDTKGIIKFQVIQDTLDLITIKIVIDKDVYDKASENKFLHNWRVRIGHKMEISLQHVSDIPVENSGKYRLVKNNIKYLIDWTQGHK